MATLLRRWKAASIFVVLIISVAGPVGSPRPAAAFVLGKTDACKPGQKWDMSRPVKVKFLSDSIFDYFTNRRGSKPGTLTDLARLETDVKAVIALYNAIPGNKLVLELDTGISGDADLSTASKENWGGQTIVIGFTSEQSSNSKTAEAWTTSAPDDGCTRTRAHIQFSRNYFWIFGPPDTTDVDTRGFTTALQTPPVELKGATRTFLGILTHEMGHALGLQHPDNVYAIMDQNFSTWFRAKDDVLRTRLLPDDTAGILALYGNPGATKPLDVSVTNTWFKPASATFDDKCATQIATAEAAARALSKATGQPITIDFPAANIFKGAYADLFAALASAQVALKACEDAQNAYQVDNCAVSSRADNWAEPIDGVKVFCGVKTKGSSYPAVSDTICPGQQIQVRYTLNNHTTLQDVTARAEVWFSRDSKLNAFDGSDIQSPDVRDFALKAASSASIGQVFKVPDTAPLDQTLYVFVRAVPYDPTTGKSLWDSDVDPWNNAIMVRHSIKVSRSVCH